MAVINCTGNLDFQNAIAIYSSLEYSIYRELLHQDPVTDY